MVCRGIQVKDTSGSSILSLTPSIGGLILNRRAVLQENVICGKALTSDSLTCTNAFSADGGKLKTTPYGTWCRGLRVTGANDADPVLVADTSGISLNRNLDSAGNIATIGVLDCGALGVTLTNLINGRARATIRAVFGI
jgi:hypothetical protein